MGFEFGREGNEEGEIRREDGKLGRGMEVGEWERVR